MRTIKHGLGSNLFRQYGLGESGRTSREVLETLLSTPSDETPTPEPEPTLGPYIPGAPHLAFSVSRRLIADFEGSAVRLYRVSDSAEQDFAFKTTTDFLDLSEIDTWAGGSALKIRTIYNQMGGSLHLQQATAANMPRFYPNGDAGFAVMSNDTPGGGNNTNTICGMTVAGVAVDRSQVSIFHTERAYFSPNRCWFELTTSATRDLGIIGASTGAMSSVGAAAMPNTTLLKTQIQTNSVVGSLTQTDVRLGDQTYTGLTAQTSKVSTGLNIGRSVSDSTKQSASDVYAHVVYREVRSDAADIHALLRTIFGEVAARAKRVVWDGDSLTAGYLANFGRNRSSLQDPFIIPANDLFNVSTYGYRFASANAAVATRAGLLLRSTDVHVVTLGINDIAADNASGAAVYTLLQTYLTNLRAVVSPKIVVCTLPPNYSVDVTQGRIQQRLDFNTLLRAGAAGLGITVGENASDATFNADVAAGTYGTTIHQNDAYYAKVAELERVGILAAIAA